MPFTSPLLVYPFLIIHTLDNPTAKFGEALRGQVEERLAFFEVGGPFRD